MTKRWIISLVFAVLAVSSLVQNGASDDLLTWGESGYGNGQFNSPAGLAADSSGNVYVADTDNNRIQKFNSDGVFLKRWGAMGQFNSPRGAAADGSGNVYVADTGNNRIQKFDSDGVFLKKWGALGQFSSPSGVAEVKNNGPNDAVELVITDQLPPGVTHVASSPSQGTYDNGTGVWDVGSLASGTYAAMTIIVSVDPGTAGASITNTASVTAVRPVDRDNDNDSASSSITVSYTITATTGANGGMEPSGAVGVVPGASQKFTMIPVEYYRVADVEVDGESVGAVTEYTFENVVSNHTIHATFELIPLELLTVTYDILTLTRSLYSRQSLMNLWRCFQSTIRRWRLTRRLTLRDVSRMFR